MKGEHMVQSAWAIAFLIVVGIVCLTFLKGCTQANEAYYKAQQECIAAGHSWVSVGGASYSANCIK